MKIKMTGLETLYKDMKAKNETYAIFDYRHNKIKLVILFDTKTTPFYLLLIKKHSTQTLLLDVEYGFNLSTFLGNKYQLLLQILEIQSGKTNPFSPKVFFKELNDKIPTNIHHYEPDYETRKLISYAKNYEEKDKVFICGCMDWDKIKNGKTYTQANREKTKILYPNVYAKIKDKNINIKYTDNKKDEKIIF
ncbi:DUF6037 family protein [Campylobacter troglodytis]|uniref:DUF6037 family protein n=1 Tax=Campylobacter troglodytis TaxID=654363 RepID=UPI001FEC3F64|nr:DUF6037 family protein [Campylobacter troglodytis]